MRTLIENVYESELLGNKLEALRQKLDNYETISSSSSTNTTTYANKLNEKQRNESNSFSSSFNNKKAKRRTEFMSQIDEETIDSNLTKFISNSQKQQNQALPSSVQTKTNLKKSQSFSFKLDEKLYNSVVLFGCLVVNQFLSTFLLAKIYSCKLNFRFYFDLLFALFTITQKKSVNIA
jgi:hypothetical protein